MKDLNVVAHDSDKEEIEEEGGDQYEITKDDKNMVTNLAGLVEQEEVEKEEENGERKRNEKEEE